LKVQLTFCRVFNQFPELQGMQCGAGIWASRVLTAESCKVRKTANNSLRYILTLLIGLFEVEGSVNICRAFNQFPELQGMQCGAGICASKTLTVLSCNIKKTANNNLRSIFTLLIKLFRVEDSHFPELHGMQWGAGI
jgi:hypothetical protein